MGEPDRAITALQKLLLIPYEGPLATTIVPLTPALLRLDPMSVSPFSLICGFPFYMEASAFWNTLTRLLVRTHGVTAGRRFRLGFRRTIPRHSRILH
jgi:hypothetical protein